MITFDELTMIRTNDPKKREVFEDCQVRLNGSYLTVISKGFRSDGMSFPWWQATWDDPWHYRYVAPAVLHDWLLFQAELPKREIDWLFEGALLAQGVPSLEAWIFKNAVRTKK